MSAAYHLLTRQWPKNYRDALDTDVRTTLASSYAGTSHMRVRSVSAGSSEVGGLEPRVF